MKTATLLLVLLMAVAAGHATDLQLDYGPAVSPVAWTKVEPAEKTTPAKFPSSARFLEQLGVPSSVVRARIYDATPFGGQGEWEASIAKFNSVELKSPDGSRSTTLAMNVAVDAETNELVCAFSDPKDRWVTSTLEMGPDIETRAEKAGWTIAPAKSSEFVSTLPQVLEAVWKRFGVDPATMGQVIVRPRFVSNRFPADVDTGEPVYPPAKVWIVEMLGGLVKERVLFGQNRALTTLVVQVRDSDLEGLPGMILP